MAKSVFISYNHTQKDFVRRDLVPVLRAAGCDVFIDHEHFGLGPPLAGQMDGLQDRAEVSLLLLSAEYLASANCVHEMDRAIAKDPGFTSGKTIAVKVQPGLAHSALPTSITGPNSLYGDLTDPANPAPWEQMLKTLEAHGLGCAAPVWLQARGRCAAALSSNRSVNLYVPGEANWQDLVESLRQHFGLRLPGINLQSPETTSRPGLIRAMLRELGLGTTVPPKHDDLPALQRQFDAAPGPCLLLLERFHNVKDRHAEYEVDLFRSLRFLQDRPDRGKAVLLLHSRQPLTTVTPPDHPDSQILAEVISLL